MFAFAFALECKSFAFFNGVSLKDGSDFSLLKEFLRYKTHSHAAP